MKVSFDGIGERPVTFLNDGAAAGAVVKVSAAGTVSGCGDGEGFDGIALFTDGDCASVRLGGFVTASYSGTAPTIGRNRLVANGAGGVKLDTGTAHNLSEGSGSFTHTVYSGDSYLVVDKDTAAKTVTFIM